MKKLKSYDFWVKIASAIILLVRIIASEFNVYVDSAIFMDIVTSIAGILVVFGIISAPSSLVKKNEKVKEEGESAMNLNEIENNEINNEEQNLYQIDGINYREDVLEDEVLPIEENNKEENQSSEESKEREEETVVFKEQEASKEDIVCDEEIEISSEPDENTVSDETVVETFETNYSKDSYNNLINRIDYLIKRLEELMD